jgi:hypothetical protein
MSSAPAPCRGSTSSDCSPHSATECAAEMNSDPTCQNAWAATVGTIAGNWQNNAQYSAPGLPSPSDRAIANHLGQSVNALGNVFGQMGTDIHSGHGGCALGTGLGLLYGMAMFGGLDVEALAVDAAKLADLADALRLADAAKQLGVPAVADNLAQLSEMLRAAAQGKGNFGVGSATLEQAKVLGLAWVGPGYRVSKTDPGILLSYDGLRMYRSPTFKPKGPTYFQANLQSRYKDSGPWPNNAHVGILQGPVLP